MAVPSTHYVPYLKTPYISQAQKVPELLKSDVPVVKPQYSAPECA